MTTRPTAPQKADAERRKRDVAARIRRAFAATPRPGPTSIAQRGEVVPFEIDFEAQAVEGFFAPMSWQDVTLSALVTEYEGDGTAAVFFLSPAAFRYYLPSYMLMPLEDFDEASGIADALVSRLNPDRRDRDAFLSDVDALSIDERRAVADFLLAMHLNYDHLVPKADSYAIPLSLHWMEYLDPEDRTRVPPTPWEAIARQKAEIAELKRLHSIVKP